MSSLVLLPVEIHGRIADFITSTRDLSHYLLLCRGIFGEVERRLYRSIRLTKYEPHIFAAFIQGLLKNSHRPLLAREFSIHSVKPIPREVVSQLASSLARMTRLTHLTIIGSKLDFYEFKRRRYRFKLQRFEFLGSAPGPDGSITGFLISQPSISILAASVYIPNEPVPSYFLPNLKVLRGSICFGKVVLPHLPLTVERLHWSPGYVFETRESYLALRILKLSASENLFNFPLATMCPNLTYLEIAAEYSVSSMTSNRP